MMAVLAFAVVLPSLVMYGTLLRVWERSGAPMCRPLAAALAPGFGLGVSSCVYFMLLLTSSRQTAMRLDAILWLAAGGWLLLDWKYRRKAILESGVSVAAGVARREWKPALAASALGCAALVGVAVAAVWLPLTVMPHGESDAVAIWNLRARSIERGAPDWAALLSPAIGWSHPDSPLLIPLAIARLWSYSGSESPTIPQLVAMLFFISSVATVGISVGRLRGPTSGLLSSMAVVAARTYVFQTSCQCADVPIGFFILVAASFVVLAREARDPAPLLLTAGASAGFASWTKNEGQLLLIVIGLFVLIAFPKRRLRALWFGAVGAALPVAVVVLFKLYLSPTSGLFALQTSDMIAGKLADKARWTMVLTQGLELMRQWGGVPRGALAGVGLAVVLTARADRLSIHRAAFGLLLVTAMLSGYALVYVITPWPLAWHIATSFERLIVQLWPATVWAAFQLTGAPQALASERARQKSLRVDADLSEEAETVEGDRRLR